VALAPREGNGELTYRLIQRADFSPTYIEHALSLLKPDIFKKRKLKIIVDVLHGTGRGYLGEILKRLGCDVTVINESRDVTFEGHGPDPSTEGLSSLIALVKKHKADLGLATDGDADRFGVVDSDGSVISANDMLALLTRYLHVSRGW